MSASALRSPLHALPDPLRVPTMPPRVRATARVRPSGSKSITNRAAVLAGLAAGESTLRGALVDADDGAVMLRAIEQLGAGVARAGADVRIRGVGGRWRAGPGGASLSLHNAGTAMRFLCASCALADGPIILDGDARMRERPIGQLVDALRALGVTVSYLKHDGFPPVRVDARAAFDGGEVVMPTAASGQFVSALLLAAPWSARGVRVRTEGAPTSPPYIRMTLDLLRALGASGVEASDDLRDVRVGRGPIAHFSLDVEPDASGATYFWAAAAMTPGLRCAVEGLSRRSAQGDARFVDVLGLMGARVSDEDGALAVEGADELRGVDVDMSDMPDAALTLAVAACFAHGPSVIRGLRTLRVKESDRLAALETELNKLDAGVSIDGDALRIDPPPARIVAAPAGAPIGAREPHPIIFETYRDHRMAMALALAGLRRTNVLVRDPGCVSKTYPSFWSDLASVVDAAELSAR